MGHPKVFISYSHETKAFGDEVLTFSNRLRREFGIDAEIDQYEENPPQGWPLWMDEQIMNADFVLVLSTKSYFDKVHRISNGKGVEWEIQCIYQHLYQSNANNQKFIPILFSDDDVAYVPTPLRPYTYYNVTDEYTLKRLVNRLHGIKNVERPEVGEYQPLPEKERKNLWLSTPIDVSLWDKAQWRGTIFRFDPTYSFPPILGLIYTNREAGQEIFASWKQEYGKNIDQYVSVSFVEPPFSILTHSSGAYAANGEGYFVVVHPDAEFAFKRAEQSGMAPEETILFTIQRYRFIECPSNDWKRPEFKKHLAKWKKCYLAPCYLTKSISESNASNIEIDFDNMFEFQNIHFKEGTSIQQHDIESVIYTEAM